MIATSYDGFYGGLWVYIGAELFLVAIGVVLARAGLRFAGCLIALVGLIVSGIQLYMTVRYMEKRYYYQIRVLAYVLGICAAFAGSAAANWWIIFCSRKTPEPPRYPSTLSGHPDGD